MASCQLQVVNNDVRGRLALVTGARFVTALILMSSVRSLSLVIVPAVELARHARERWRQKGAM